MEREKVKEKIPNLTDEQLDWLIQTNEQEVESQKATVATLTTERDTLKTQLGEANTKLEGYDPEWKSKAETARQDAEKQIAAMKYEYAAASAAGTLKFSSESAKRAFLSDLKAKNLPIENEKLLGLDDFVKNYKESDPEAFLSDEKPPVFAASATGGSNAASDKDKANAALRAAFGKGV